MFTNLTIDDTSLDIVFSTDWATQFENDPNTDLFFGGSYHSAQADGASANITFNGSSIYLFGSKGPNHANYSVQFDNFIIFLSASASQTLYQQPLFGFTFNTTGTHFISLTSHYVPDGQWLDLDYITITANNTNDGPIMPSGTPIPLIPATMTPPWLTLSASSPTASLPTSMNTSLPGISESSSSSANSKTNSATLILSIAFGTLIAVALLIGAILFFCRRRRLSSSLDTPPSATGSEFLYKVPLTNSQQSSPALVSPDVYSAQSPTSIQRTDPFARIPTSQTEHEVPRSHSPWSAFSQGAATTLTQQSATRLLNTQTQTHARSQLQTHARGYSSSQAHLPSPLIQQMTQATNSYNQLPITSVPPAYNQSRIALASGSATYLLPPDDGTRYQHVANSSQTHIIPPTTVQSAIPPKRPKRPRENLLDWLGNSLYFERKPSIRRRRDDDSERTDFLQV